MEKANKNEKIDLSKFTKPSYIDPKTKKLIPVPEKIILQILSDLKEGIKDVLIKKRVTMKSEIPEASANNLVNNFRRDNKEQLLKAGILNDKSMNRHLYKR